MSHYVNFTRVVSRDDVTIFKPLPLCPPQISIPFPRVMYRNAAAGNALLYCH